MATRMQQRRGTAQQWTDADPILAAGEIGFETDTNQFKIGDGVNAWSDLSYFKNLEDLGGSLDDYVPVTTKGQSNGVAELDSNGQVPLNQLGNLIDGAPATLNTLKELADAVQNDATFAATILSSLATKASVTSLTDHAADTTNVHGIADTSLLAYKSEVAAVTKGSLGLGSVDNTSDEGKPVSTAQAAAITAAIASAASNTTGQVDGHNSDTTNVHGIADTSVLETVSGSQSKANAAAASAVTTHNSATTNVHGIADTSLLALKSEVAAVTKTSLGLGSVDNTADTAKPVSTAQSQAIATAKAEAIADATSQVNALLSGAPAALNTLDELAAALGDDANFAASVTTSLGLKVDSLTPISQKSASYTLSSLTERDDLIEMGSGSAMTLTIPADATLNFPIGTSLDILQTSTGQVTIAGAGGVTVNATPGLKLRTQWSSVTLFKRAANTWVAFGDLTA
jgi:hypothetical protein